MVIEQNEDAIAIPDFRQTIFKTSLDRHVMHGLAGMVVAHCPVNAGLKEIAGPDLLPLQIVPGQ
jgi:hypothetical protein